MSDEKEDSDESTSRYTVTTEMTAEMDEHSAVDISPDYLIYAPIGEYQNRKVRKLSFEFLYMICSDKPFY